MRGRFAPSPTGRMHLGNARTALLAWLQVRSAGGEFLLRIEDLDAARSRPAWAEELQRDMEYLGLTWDGPVVFQSRRGEAYVQALEALERAGRLYPCFCSRAEVSRAASAPHGPSDEGPRYPGTCRALTPEERARKAGARRAALRFQPAPGTTSFVDAVHGPFAQDVEAEVGDFVVRKNDGTAAYQLAVVVDDAASGVTHVLRADDLLASTPRQLQLGQTLGFPAPAFAHVPLLLGEDGKRLAKREGLFAISDLRTAGVAPEKVVGLLAGWSGLSDGRTERASELAGRFTLDALPRSPAVVREADIAARLR